MTVGRICQREVDLADVDESIVVSAKRMNDRNVGTLVILDESKRPVGIITDRDVAVRVVAGGMSPDDTKVGDVMTAHPRTVTENTRIEDALSTMKRLGIRRMLVIDDLGGLQGIISLDDVLALLMEEFRSVQGILECSTPCGALV